jgi:hypothetical protein
MQWLWARGYLVGDVEQAKWLPVGEEECEACGNPELRFWRKDLFGFGDLVAIKADEPTILVQSSADAGVAIRLKASAEFERYLRSDRLAHLHTWSRPVGSRRLWLLRRYNVVLSSSGLEATRMLEEPAPVRAAGRR